MWSGPSTRKSSHWIPFAPLDKACPVFGHALRFGTGRGHDRNHWGSICLGSGFLLILGRYTVSMLTKS